MTEEDVLVRPRRATRAPYWAHRYTCDQPECRAHLTLACDRPMDRDQREARLPRHGWTSHNGQHLCPTHAVEVAR